MLFLKAMKQFKLLFLTILAYFFSNSNNVIGKKNNKKPSPSHTMSKSLEYILFLVPNASNVVQAHEELEKKTCLNFTRTQNILSYRATVIKKGRDCSANAYIMGDYISFGITLNEDCMDSEMIQKLIYWNVQMRYQFSKCLPKGNGQGYIKEKKMKDVIKKYKCDVKNLYSTKVTVKEHYIEYSYLRILKKDNFKPKSLPQVDYSRKIAFIDIRGLKDKLCKDTCSSSSRTKCENYGILNPKSCDKCICPFFFKGKNCKDYTKSKDPKKCKKDLFKATSRKRTVTLNLEHECFYRIEPTKKNRKIRVTFTPNRPIYWNCNKKKFLEIKYYNDKAKDGLILCERILRFTLKSSEDATVLVYHSSLPYNGFKVKMAYKQIKVTKKNKKSKKSQKNKKSQITKKNQKNNKNQKSQKNHKNQKTKKSKH